MGGSYWSEETYKERSATRAVTGESAFVYDSKMKTSRPEARKTHEALLPKNVTRESRDSEAHPESNAIGVVFDVTGSMGSIPRVLQEKLPKLLGLLTSKGYIPDPQILFGAVGDWTCDNSPLQMGQFESGNEMEGDLGRLFLEGGGGSGLQESYIEALYFFARHTETDCFEKRGKKGYLFLIGDEKSWPKVTVDEAESVFGDKIQAPVSLEQLLGEAREKYQVFFLMPKTCDYSGMNEIENFWKQLLGQNFIALKDASAVSETIAAIVGLSEGTIDLDEARKHLSEVGVASKTVATVAEALDGYSKSLVKYGSGDLTVSSSPPVTRL